MHLCIAEGHVGIAGSATWWEYAALPLPMISGLLLCLQTDTHMWIHCSMGAQAKGGAAGGKGGQKGKGSLEGEVEGCGPSWTE